MNSNPSTYVLDNTVLTNFSRIERLDLLTAFSGNLCITREVRQEMEAGIAGSAKKDASLSQRLAGTRELLATGVIAVESPSSLDGLALYAELQGGQVLGKGEISSMVLALECGGIFVTDDEKAWKESKKRGVQVFGIDYLGTKWILRDLVASSVITEQNFEELRGLLSKNRYIF
ncbi:hypothetical protein KGQ71_04275 [Patescibacteria group bacterium]|nr:hypothetical protein [Patescibacteria group bacterium]